MTSQPADRRPYSVWYLVASISVLVCAALWVLFSFKDYGITTDEPVQLMYGTQLLSFFLSDFTDESAFQFSDLHFYGGLFELPAAVWVQLLPFNAYETRHLLSGLVGVLGIAGAWRVTRLLGGDRAGFLATVLLAFTATYSGAMFHHTKDVPLAAAMIWMLYYSCRLISELPRFRLATVVKFALAFGAVLTLRVAGAIALVSLGLTFAAYLVVLGRTRGILQASVAAVQMGVRLLLCLPVVLTMVAVFWPWALFSPLNVVEAVRIFSRFPHEAWIQVNGRGYSSTDAPWDYLLFYLLLKLPETVLIGCGAALLFAIRALRREGSEALGDDLLSRTLQWLLVAVTVFFPIAFFIVKRPTVYDGMRHFLFLVPVLVVVAAAGLDRLWFTMAQRGRAGGAAFAGLLVAALLFHGWTMNRLHPYEYLYFNSLAGGVKGADQRFDLDYGGTALREATAGLRQYLEARHHGSSPDRVYRVFVCGPEDSAKSFMSSDLWLTRDGSEADFVVASANAPCPAAEAGRRIITVERLGAVFAYVAEHTPDAAGRAAPAQR